MNWRVWQYRLSRLAGRVVTRTCSVLTLGRMPPFVSVSAVATRDDRVLIVVDPILGEPVLPGGHLQWSESPVRALVREVQEETGYTISPRKLLGVYSADDLDGERGIVRVVYEVTVVGGNMASSPEGEARWLPLGDFLSQSGRDAPILRHWLGDPPAPQEKG